MHPEKLVKRIERSLNFESGNSLIAIISKESDYYALAAGHEDELISTLCCTFERNPDIYNLFKKAAIHFEVVKKHGGLDNYLAEKLN